jgi:hypothetical protein
MLIVLAGGNDKLIRISEKRVKGKGWGGSEKGFQPRFNLCGNLLFWFLGDAL